jgi:hypothetical protein
MTDKTKWCSLCERYVVPKKHFNSIGWIGFVGALSVLVASASLPILSQYTTTTTIAASLETGMGNIVLNVLILLAAPFLLVSILYCVYYGLKNRRCPICNSSDFFDVRPQEYREISTEMEDVPRQRAPVPRRQTR